MAVQPLTIASSGMFVSRSTQTSKLDAHGKKIRANVIIDRAALPSVPRTGALA
jgi:hypothetical protein